QRIKMNKELGADSMGLISKRDMLMIGYGLYWGEGYKYENCELGFTNSNLGIIKFYINWLRLFNISKGDLIFRLTINEIFKSKEKEIKEFWIKNLQVRPEQFSATTFTKTTLKKADIANIKS